jgi:fatty acid synthase
LNAGYYNLPRRHGKVKDATKFDAGFFGIVPKQANCMDPQLRMLLEVAYEAIVDAGLNPASLRGTSCGVFVGCAASETAGSLTTDADQIVGYTLTGCTRSMFANRISFFFDLRGPSLAVDTACSSSLVAMQVCFQINKQLTTMLSWPSTRSDRASATAQSWPALT